MKRDVQLLTVLLMSIVFGVSAQTFGDRQVLFSDIGMKYLDDALVKGDIDGDGDIDFISSASNKEFFQLYKNNGDNTYELIEVPNNNGRETLAMADINNDGLVDIICTTNTILLQQPDGTFVEEFINDASSIETYYRCNIVDMDGDGLLDIVALNYKSFDFDLMILKNKGNLEFEPILLNDTYDHGYTTVVDYNEDGLPDILSVFKNQDVNFIIQVNNGDGTFIEEAIVDNDDTTESVNANHCGMSNYSSFGGQDISYFGSDGFGFLTNVNGNFTTPVDQIYSEDDGFYIALKGANLNNAGRDDMVILVNPDGTDMVRVFAVLWEDFEYQVIEVDVFDGISSYIWQFPKSFDNWIQIEDMNDDGLNDIIITDLNGDGVYMYENKLVSSVTDIKPKSSYEVYPNPTSDIINFSFDNAVADQVEIFRMDGKKVYQTATVKNTLNIGFLKQGSYTLKLKFDDRYETSTFMKL